MAARQKKREDNLAMRGDRRKNKKRGKAKAQPGFEGSALAEESLVNSLRVSDSTKRERLRSRVIHEHSSR